MVIIEPMRYLYDPEVHTIIKNDIISIMYHKKPLEYEEY